MNVLARVMAHPEALANLSGAEWDDLLVHARNAKVLARLYGFAEERELLPQLPAAAQDVLQGARIYADYRQLLAKRELHELNKLFEGVSHPVVLLKGAAYLLADIPLGRGRRLNDIDILVPAANLAATEGLLQDAGWDFEETLTPYDERYYRQWTHEIPPLRHPDSPLELDVHHNLIQPTGRIKLDSGKLFDALVPIPGTCFSVLSPADMLLHSATHLFMSDELRGGIRDLIDMQMLCASFSATRPGYWDEVADRADALGLQRPLYYAAAAMRRLLGADIPASAWNKIHAWRPAALPDRLMQFSIDQHLAPASVGMSGSWLAANLLFIRSHWIRMPPGMLVRHLVYKWWLGLKGEPAAS